MKHEIIKTKDYLFVVSDEEIKKGDWVTNKLDVYKVDGYYGFQPIAKKIIAHLPLNGAEYLEGVDVLPMLEDEVNLLAEQSVPDGFRTIWKSAYNKAKETYKYTEEDLKNAMIYGMVQIETGFKGINSADELFTLILSKIGQPKLPVAFECECKYFTTDGKLVKTEWVGKYIW